MIWSANDSKLARINGWDVSPTSVSGGGTNYAIVADGDRFQTDVAAVKHVMQSASLRDGLAIRALAMTAVTFA